VRALDRASRALHERADGGAGEEKGSGEEECNACDQRPGAPDERPDELLEPGADPAAGVREEQKEPEGHGSETPAERMNLHELAPAQHQGADDDERGGHQVAGVADDGPEPVDDPPACAASLPPQVHERAEEEADGGEAEADQLGMVVAALFRAAPAALDAGRNSGFEGALFTPFGHARLLRRAGGVPYLGPKAVSRWSVSGRKHSKPDG
jgi:hypothetical protein